VFLVVTTVGILAACPTIPDGPGPKGDCPIPIPTWTTEEHNYNREQTLELLAELRAVAETQVAQMKQGGKADLDLSAVFNSAIQNRQKKTFVISQSATQAALAMRELQCAIWRENISTAAAEKTLLALVDKIAGAEVATTPKEAQHTDKPRNIWDDASSVFDEARTNIAWVILEDRGAKERYDKARDSKKSKYESVLEAQDHNPHAQEVIRRFGEARTEGYIGALGH